MVPEGRPSKLTVSPVWEADDIPGVGEVRAPELVAGELRWK